MDFEINYHKLINQSQSFNPNSKNYSIPAKITKTLNAIPILNPQIENKTLT